MWIKKLQDTDEALVLKVKTFSEGEKTVCFFPSEIVDTIDVGVFDKLSGFYNPDFKEKAEELHFWDEILVHEVLHFYKEFIAPWYATIDVLPDDIPSEVISTVPNLIEDIAINHTLWLWEVNPMRSAGYGVPNITEKLIQYYDNFLDSSSLPSSLAAVQECIGIFHFEILKQISNQRKEFKKTESCIHLKNTIYIDIKSLSNKINHLINTLAVSLNVEKNSMIVNLNINPGKINRPSFETRYKGTPIPQFVTLNQVIISNIYDLLDIHFSEAYNIDIMKLRKDAYLNYKKTILDEKKKASKIINNVKSFRFNFEKRVEKNKHIIDFYFDIVDKKSNLKNTDKSDKRISVEQKIVPWEKYTRMKSSELLRLKKWVE